MGNKLISKRWYNIGIFNRISVYLSLFYLFKTGVDYRVVRHSSFRNYKD